MLTITPCAAPPLNDVCANAIHLGVGNVAPLAFDNALAMRDGLVSVSSCGSTGTSNIERDLWYRWTAGPDADGLVTIRAYGTSITLPVLVYEDGPCGSLTSYVTFTCMPVVPGHTYVIRIGSATLLAAPGAGVIEITGNNP